MSLQKFGSIRADVIEQMRFKQRLRVIQTIEDTTKRNVVRIRLILLQMCQRTLLDAQLSSIEHHR